MRTIFADVDRHRGFIRNIKKIIFKESSCLATLFKSMNILWYRIYCWYAFQATRPFMYREF